MHSCNWKQNIILMHPSKGHEPQREMAPRAFLPCDSATKSQNRMDFYDLTKKYPRIGHPGVKRSKLFQVGTPELNPAGRSCLLISTTEELWI